MDPVLIHINDTTKFLLPLVIKEGYTYKDIQKNLIGAYNSAFELSEYEQHIFVVFNEDVKPICLKETYIDRITIFNEKENAYDYIFIYELDASLLEDYIYFINGDYSKLNNRIKEQILQFWQAKEDTFLYSILYKNQQNIKNIIKKSRSKDNPWNHIYILWRDRLKRNQELYRSPRLKEEMYGYNSEL